MNQKGSVIADINFLISAFLILTAICWPYIQKGVNWYYKREANVIFMKITKSEINHRARYSKYLPFGIHENTEQLNTLTLDLKDRKYFDYGVFQKGGKTYEIIAQMKPELLKKWYLIGPKAEVRLVKELK